LQRPDRLTQVLGVRTERMHARALNHNRLLGGCRFAVDLFEPLTITLAIEVERFGMLALLVGARVALVQRSVTRNKQMVDAGQDVVSRVIALRR
jgi:hypothetical protein